MTRIAVFGWGVIAPGAATIDEFERVLASGASQLSPFGGYGPDTFLVGRPSFDFARYEPWLAERFPPGRARQLTDKMDPTTLYAVGAFIQALGQNAPVERLLGEAGGEAHVYVGNALGALPTIHDSSLDLYRAQRRWNRFWSDPIRNPAHAEYLAAPSKPALPVVDPSTESDPDAREALEDGWFAYWAERSAPLSDYLGEFARIESQAIEGDVESGKMKLMRDKRRALGQLRERWNAPEPPWASVSANLLWNIPNTPAAQISMLGKITGPAVAPVAACSTFGVALKLGMGAITRGEAKLAVIGSADPPPHPLTVGAFYSARVLSADRTPSKPLSQLKGTHVAGGACIWIIGDLEWGRERGLVPLGAEPLAVGLSSDADHIITPSEEGPRQAMRSALSQAKVDAREVVTWDLHATATPGDYQELENLRSIAGPKTRVTARKGTFGHGMGVGGGWELTAQYLSLARGQLFPTALSSSELHESIRALGQSLVFDRAEPLARGVAGKLSMGVGGINACTISRPLDVPQE